MIKERIDHIVAELQEKSDSTTERKLDYIQKMIQSAVNYVRTVVVMGAQMDIAKFRMEPEDYRMFVEQLDCNRRLAHNSFIIKLNVVNRICLDLGFDPIYDGPDHRADKGEFAFSLVEEYRINVRG